MKTVKFSAKSLFLAFTSLAFCAMSLSVAAQITCDRPAARLDCAQVGNQGQDARSHASANVREYEKVLKENLDNADQHRKMAVEQNNQVNRVGPSLGRDFPAEKSEYSDKEL